MPFSLLSFLQDPETKASVTWSMKYFSQDDTIVEEGSIGQEVFLITRGTVHIYASVLLANDQIKDKGIANLLLTKLLESCLFSIMIYVVLVQSLPPIVKLRLSTVLNYFPL